MLELQNLCKAYQGQPALTNLSLSVPSGTITALLGPNGAGKTTTLKILTGLLKADSGTILWEGQVVSPQEPSWRQQLSFMPDLPYLYPRLTGWEHLHFHADLYHTPREGREPLFDNLFDILDFSPFRNHLVESYSAGTKRKLLLAQALAVNPRVLLLDEPLISIDPLVMRRVMGYLKNWVREGRVILFATHILALAREIGDQVAIIHQGAVSRHLELASQEASWDTQALEDLYLKTVAGEADGPA